MKLFNCNIQPLDILYHDPFVGKLSSYTVFAQYMLVVKFVVGLGKRVLHFMYTVCLQGWESGIRKRLGAHKPGLNPKW